MQDSFGQTIIDRRGAQGGVPDPCTIFKGVYVLFDSQSLLQLDADKLGIT